MTSGASSQGMNAAIRDMSPSAVAAAAWFRQLDRALKVFRLYRPDNPLVLQTQARMADGLTALLKEHGTLELRVTPSQIFAGPEVIVSADTRVVVDGVIGSSASQLPFLFYRDGIRRMRLLPTTQRSEMDSLFEALKMAGAGPLTNDDLVTLLWQSNLVNIQVDSVPYEQTIYLSSRGGGGRRGGGGHSQTFAIAPSGEEIHAELGQAQGAQGLHKDTFDDWALPEGDPIPVAEAYEKLLPSAERFREYLAAEWVAENSIPWTAHVADLMRKILKHIPGEDSQYAVAHALSTWIVTSIQRGEWEMAQRTLLLLKEADPDVSIARQELKDSLEGVDKAAIVERLDEGSGEDHSRFVALVVALGEPAVDLACEVLGRAERSRTRAAASTALSFLCAERPQLLEPYLSDSRWYLVRNLVFVLGQIGGPQVTDLLHMAAMHPEPRVRRQVVQALGNVPRLERVPILLAQLDTTDGQLLAAALQLLTREKDPLVARALLDRIEAPVFESRSEANRRAMFSALAEVADDSVVGALEGLLYRGGWFARRTLERSAAARVLGRVGTEKALAVLENGLRSRSDAVRSACLEAMSQKGTS